MTEAEFEAKAKNWTRIVEDVLVNMSSITSEDGLILASNHRAIADEFEKELTRLRLALKNNVVRPGLKVHANA